MIKIQIPSDKDKTVINDLLAECSYNNVNLDKKINNSMAVYDGNKIVGFASYLNIKDDDNIGIIDIIAIKEEFRGQYIGDGLIKSLLNLADKRGISRIYAIVNPLNSLFFKRIGFTKRTDKSYEILKKYLNLKENEENTEVFEAKLPDFFNRSCRSSL